MTTIQDKSTKTTDTFAKNNMQDKSSSSKAQHSHVHNHKHDHSHDHNCATCHEETAKEKETNTHSLIKKLHEKNGHACIDGDCEFHDVAHSHIKTEGHSHKHHEHSHEHGHKHDAHTHHHDHHAHNHDHHSCSHDHDHKHEDKSKQSFFKPLNEVIQGLKISPTYKNLFSYISNLGTSLPVSAVLQNLGAPNMVIAPLSLSAMHVINRGFKKFERLGLAGATSLLAFFAQQSGISKSLIRPVAAALIFLIERAGLNPHIHKHGDKKELHLHEGKEYGFKNLANQLKTGLNKEFLTSLFKLEFNVNTVIPAVNYLSNILESGLVSLGLPKTITKINSLFTKIFAMSAGLLFLDNFWNSLTKMGADNKDSQSITAADSCPICGMDGLHVCITEASEAGSESATISEMKVGDNSLDHQVDQAALAI